MKATISLMIAGFIFAIAISACASPKLPGEGKVTPVAPSGTSKAELAAALSEHRFGAPLTWDTDFQTPPCALDDNAPVFDEALAIAGLDRKGFGFGRDDLLNSPEYTTGLLTDGHPLPWFEKLRENPAYAGCFEGEVVGEIKHHYLNSQTPVSDIIRDAAVLLGADPKLLGSVTNQTGTFNDAITTLCEISGGCDEPTGDMPEELKEAIAPLLYAISLGIKAKQRMDATVGKHHDPEWWRKHGGNLLMISVSGERPDLQSDEDRAYILDESGARKELYRAASDIARQVELVNWLQFKDLMGVEFDLRTEAGWIQIRDGSNHVYADDGKDILLGIDLGGNDTHIDPVAVNTSAKNAVSIDIDLSGKDIRTYGSYTTPYDKDGLLPADRYGRFPGDGRFGSISLSRDCRQGAGLNGIAMLFDFGEGNDHYQSLRCSQGYTHGGVGTVFDGGGNNVFLSETTSQASAQFGIAARVVKGRGANISSSFSNSQGFGYVQGAGIDISGPGDDTNICDPGDPSYGGTPLYYSPQLPGKGNASFCQGAGLGERGKSEDGWKAFLAGGFGLKLDIGGNNDFTASVFSQGVGYWQGTGILDVQGKGDNTFDALWYGQGAAAHHAVGMFFRSGEGNDTFNERLKPVAIMDGAGHDFSAGIFVNDTGNATMRIPLLSAGAGNCNGLGLFVVNRGGNNLAADSEWAKAVANVKCSSSEIPEEYRAKIRDDSINWSIPGGIDTKSAAIMMVVGDNHGEWVNKRNGSDKEYSAGIIRPEGETGIHAGK
jgi:hypothetical protein